MRTSAVFGRHSAPATAPTGSAWAAAQPTFASSRTSARSRAWMLPEPLFHDVTGGSSLGYPELERGAGPEDAPGAVAAGRLRTGVALGASEAVTGATLPAGDVEGPASAT